MLGPNGYGETRQIDPNTNEDGSDNPEGRAENRRTELNAQDQSNLAGRCLHRPAFRSNARQWS